MGRAEAARLAVVARWIAARPPGERVARLVGGPVRVLRIGAPAIAPAGVLAGDPALAEIRVEGAAFVVAAASGGVRAIAQRLLGGPPELDAPRPLTAAEQAVWALVVAAALADAGAPAEVGPLVDRPPAGPVIELVLDVAGRPLTVIAACPPDLALRVPPARPAPCWPLALPVVLGSCALPAAALADLRVGAVVVLGPAGPDPAGASGLALWVGAGAIGLRAAHGAVEAEVVTGYNARDMALPDEAHLELTVQLGATQLSLRQLTELVPGQVVPLGRPLAGPFEVRAAGRLIGAGELVDVDGELGVRIVSLQD